jgi:hypothetical protein
MPKPHWLYQPTRCLRPCLSPHIVYRTDSHGAEYTILVTRAEASEKLVDGDPPKSILDGGSPVAHGSARLLASIIPHGRAFLCVLPIPSLHSLLPFLFLPLFDPCITAQEAKCGVKCVTAQRNAVLLHPPACPSAGHFSRRSVNKKNVQKSSIPRHSTDRLHGVARQK